MEKQIKKYGWITNVVLMLIADITLLIVANKLIPSLADRKGSGAFGIIVSILGIAMVGIKVFKEWDSIKTNPVKLTALVFGLLGTIFLLAASSYNIDVAHNWNHLHPTAVLNALTSIALIGNVGSLGVYIYQNK